MSNLILTLKMKHKQETNANKDDNLGGAINTR